MRRAWRGVTLGERVDSTLRGARTGYHDAREISMSSERILICDDGSQRAEHSFHRPAALVAGGTAIVPVVPPNEPPVS
jgi:hypothetical protein